MEKNGLDGNDVFLFFKGLCTFISSAVDINEGYFLIFNDSLVVVIRLLCSSIHSDLGIGDYAHNSTCYTEHTNQRLLLSKEQVAGQNNNNQLGVTDHVVRKWACGANHNISGQVHEEGKDSGSEDGDSHFPIHLEGKNITHRFSQ